MPLQRKNNLSKLTTCNIPSKSASTLIWPSNFCHSTSSDLFTRQKLNDQVAQPVTSTFMQHIIHSHDSIWFNRAFPIRRSCIQFSWILISLVSYQFNWHDEISLIFNFKGGYTLSVMRDLYTTCARFANKRAHREPSAKSSIYTIRNLFFSNQQI